jgi:predicted MFS family arabinose efflux permease
VTPKYAWVILGVVYLATMAGSIVMNKVSPVIPALADAFGVDLGQAGLLIAVMGLTSLLLALPAGVLTRRLGLRASGAIGLALVGLGATLGALSPGFGALIASRILEGIGAAIVTIVSPTAISAWFPTEKIGSAMGIWSTATPIGGFVAMAVAPAVETIFGWSGVWWATALAALVVLILYWLSIRSAQDRAQAHSIEPSKSVFSNRALWGLGFANLCFALAFLPIIAYYPTFLNGRFAMPMTQAGLVAGLIGLSTLVGAPLAGWLSDRLRTRKWVIVAGFGLLVPMLALVFQLPRTTIVPVLLLLGLCASAIPTMAFAAAPESVEDPRSAAMSLALVTAGMNLGTVIGPPLFGRLADTLGWAAAGYALVVPLLLGALVVGLNRKLR